MPAPSALTIATQSVQRLVKEESYYRKSLEQQVQRTEKLDADLKAAGAPGAPAADENAEYMLKQEQRAVEETRAVFEPLRQRIAEAVQRLEEQLATAESDGQDSAPEAEIAKAKEALTAGSAVVEPSSS